MSHNVYPGMAAHEGDGGQTPETAFDDSFNRIFYEPQPEMPGLQVEDVYWPSWSRQIVACTPHGEERCRLRISAWQEPNANTGQNDRVIAVEASSGRPLVSVRYRKTWDIAAGDTVTAMPLRAGGTFSEAEAAFLSDIGLAVVALRADSVKESARSGADGLRQQYFPDAAELALVPGMPGAVAAHQG